VTNKAFHYNRALSFQNPLEPFYPVLGPFYPRYPRSGEGSWGGLRRLWVGRTVRLNLNN